MAKKSNKPSLFTRAMNFADRFFNGVDKFKDMAAEAEKKNVEFLDEKIPGFKENYEKSRRSAQELGSKLEAKAEKMLFGKDLYLGAGGEERKAADAKQESLDERIKSAEAKKATPISKTNQPEKGPER